MIALFFVVLTAALLVAVSLLAKSRSISARTERFSRGFNRLLLFTPAAAAAVFLILFLFVLRGRFYERLSHAALFFALWLCAARFYWFLLSYFKHRVILLLAVAGFAVSAAEAVVLTPLDRYVTLLHSFTGAASLASGIVLLALFYMLSPSVKPKSGVPPQQ